MFVCFFFGAGGVVSNPSIDKVVDEKANRDGLSGFESGGKIREEFYFFWFCLFDCSSSDRLYFIYALFMDTSESIWVIIELNMHHLGC